MAKKTTAKGKAAANPEAVKRPRVTAGPCEKHPAHTNTRVYCTKGTTRHAVCDDCGHTWKLIAPRADADKQYLAELADALHEAEPVTKDDGAYILLDVKLRGEIVAKLRKIAGS